MTHFSVTGMTCAACQARVEKAVSSIPGVTECTVSLLTNSMGVEGTADPKDIIKAVTDAGYGASLKNEAGASLSKNTREDGQDREISIMKARLISSVIILVPLMYVSMGHMMWNFPLPQAFAENHLAQAIYQLLLTTAIMVINQRFFVSGFKALIHRAPNMDSLVAIGAGASFGYSLYALFAMTAAQMSGDHMASMALMDEMYFESAATILTLITVGKFLEAKSKGRTTSALKSLMSLAPKTARIIKDGEETEVPIESVRVGDVFLVRPGENIPVDGRILEGNSAIDESALTGESVPVDKDQGNNVYAGTTNCQGFIKCEALRVGEDTSFSKIVQMVSDAASSKAPIAKIADRVSGVFVPAVMAIAAVTFIVWIIVSGAPGFALARAISVLVISCPCSLGLATPVAIMVGSGLAAKNGILFKSSISLEETGKTKIVAMDKTGTITKGEPVLTEVLPSEGISRDYLLQIACSLEEKSSHPLALAIVKAGKERGIESFGTTDFTNHSGSGISGNINGETFAAGNIKFIKNFVEINTDIRDRSVALAKKGETPLFFAKKGQLLGIITLSDIIREDSPEAISALKDIGIQVVMITGDNEDTARVIGDRAGVSSIVAGVLPDGKKEAVEAFRTKGKVAMVGDGINDAPALTVADTGIAIGAGMDVAIDAADVVLVKSSLLDAVAAIKISKTTLRNIHQNLFWAFFYNCLGIPLAAGVFIPLLGWTLNPMFGAAAMSLSSVCVVLNALRINLYNPYKNINLPGTEVTEYTNTTKEVTMKITVNGMSCPHCEAHTKEALEKIEGIAEATCDHTTNSAIIITNKEVPEEELRSAVEAAGYEYGGIIEK